MFQHMRDNLGENQNLSDTFQLIPDDMIRKEF